MLRNINENFGMGIEFESVAEMHDTIMACGYVIPEDGLIEGRDYEVVGCGPV